METVFARVQRCVRFAALMDDEDWPDPDFPLGEFLTSLDYVILSIELEEEFRPDFKQLGAKLEFSDDERFTSPKHIEQFLKGLGVTDEGVQEERRGLLARILG